MCKELEKQVKDIKLQQRSSMLLYLLYYNDIQQDDSVFREFDNVGGVMYDLHIQGLTEYKNVENLGDFGKTWSITLKGIFLINHITNKI